MTTYQPLLSGYSEINPDHFMDNMEHRVGRPLEGVALALGADAITLLLTDTAPERSPERAMMRRAAGAKGAENAMDFVTVEYLALPDAYPEAFDADDFNAYHQGNAYALAA